MNKQHQNDWYKLIRPYTTEHEAIAEKLLAQCPSDSPLHMALENVIEAAFIAGTLAAESRMQGHAPEAFTKALEDSI